MFPRVDPGSENRSVELQHRLKSDVLPLLRPVNDRSREEAFGFWRWFIESYSKASLTYETDKLVAISGIARSMQLSSVIGT